MNFMYPNLGPCLPMLRINRFMTLLFDSPPEVPRNRTFTDSGSLGSIGTFICYIGRGSDSVLLPFLVTYMVATAAAAGLYFDPINAILNLRYVVILEQVCSTWKQFVLHTILPDPLYVEAVGSHAMCRSYKVYIQVLW